MKITEVGLKHPGHGTVGTRSGIGHWAGHALAVVLATTILIDRRVDASSPGAPDAPKKLVAAPGPEARRTAERQIRDVFRSEFEAAAKSPAARAELARHLLKAGGETTGDPASQFELFQLAADEASGAGDAPTAVAAVDAQAAQFEIPAWARKASALSEALRAARSPEQYASVANAAAAVTRGAMASDELIAAREACATWVAAARRAGEAGAAKEAEATSAEIRSVEGQQAAVKGALATLKARPDDPQANLSVGRYRCFTRGQWSAGLPLLARGSDATLRDLARSELANPVDAEAQAKLADGWSAVAAREPIANRDRVEAHAAEWYRKAIHDSGGLLKATLEKRLAELAPMSITVGSETSWNKSSGPARSIPADHGFCILSEIGGAFRGDGQEVRLGVGPDGLWVLAGKAGGFDPEAKSLALLTAGTHAVQLAGEYTWTASRPAPVRMIRHDEGFCVLAGIRGGLRGEGDWARVYVADDGYWYLAGAAKSALTAYALAIRPARAGTFHALVREHKWKAGDAPVKLIPAPDGFCYLSGVGGKFEGESESVRVASEDGTWLLRGGGAQQSLWAEAISVQMDGEGSR